MKAQIKAATIGGIAGFLVASIGLYWNLLPIYSSGTVTLFACAVVLVCIFTVARNR